MQTRRKDAKVENAQAVTQAILQAAIEAAMAAVQAMSEAAGPAERNGASTTECMSATTHEPALKQVIFNWKVQDTYKELINLEMEVKIYIHDGRVMISVTVIVHMIMNWFGMLRTQFCTNITEQEQG